MLNKVPLLVIFLMIVFLITSLMTFIAMERVVEPKEVETQAQTSLATGMVKIQIVNPNYEKKVIEDGTDIK